MILKIHSDASYLSEPEARSRVGGHYYLGKNNTDHADRNGVILALTAILRHVASSAAEAEVAALFINGREGAVLRTTLEEMGHPQPATPIQTDNSTAAGITNANIRQQRSRAMDMRYYWIRDRARQGHFCIHWKPAATNLADYQTKHFPPQHHRNMRPVVLYVPDK